MTLRQLRCRFTLLVAQLIFEAQHLGYEVAGGYWMRSTEEQARLHKENPKGAAPPGRSCHEFGLAIDILLYQDRHYLRSTEHYRQLGAWWVAQSTPDYECVWGGDFSDGGHFSFKYGTRK